MPTPATTRFVAGSIRWTLAPLKFSTQTAPSAETIPQGPPRTGTRATTAFVAGSTRTTSFAL